MNKEYTYIEGKVVISDEHDSKTQRDYYDNLDKVLVQENLIETMEKTIEELEEESKSYQKKNSKHYIPIIFPTTLLMTTVGSPAIVNLLTSTNLFITKVDTVFGQISQAMAVTIPMVTCIFPLGAMLEFSMYCQYKDSLKKEKGIDSKLTFLREQVKIEKEKLKELKQEKSKIQENTEFRTVKVNDTQQLETLNNYLELYYDLGYNGEKYYQYYQQGKLEKKLKKYYSDSGVQLAKEYIEENGYSLVLRKRKKYRQE